MTRIIAGKAKGRTIEAPRGDRTRPTTDRTKEALFSSLASWLNSSAEDGAGQLSGCSFLDLFSGSGSIALEAASRGASPVTGVEVDRQTAALIRRNVEKLGLAVEVRSMSVASFLAGVGEAFDLVFADPPYDLANSELEAHLVHLVGGWLSPGALVVVERARRSKPFYWPPEFVETWSRRYGETTLYFGTFQTTEA